MVQTFVRPTEHRKEEEMPTFIAVTACNGPRLSDPEGAQKVIERYCWDGDVVPVIRKDEAGRQSHLALHGYDWPGAWRIPDGVRKAEFEPDYDLDSADGFEEFLKELAPFLAEPLTVQAVGSERCRFPISACEWHVRPRDTVVEVSGFRYSIPELSNTMAGNAPQPPPAPIAVPSRVMSPSNHLSRPSKRTS
jgi:hypothetical protein